MKLFYGQFFGITFSSTIPPYNPQRKKIFHYLYIQIVFVLLTTLNVSGQNQSYWHPTSTVRRDASILENKQILTHYQLFALDINSFKEAIAGAPQRSAGNSKDHVKIIYFPDATGTLQSYSVFETSNMEPALAASYPEIKSYVCKGIEDPTAVLYFSLSPLGLETMLIRADKPAVFIEPYTTDQSVYAVYNKGDKRKSLSSFECRIVNSVDKIVDGSSAALRPNADDGNYRVFRLALSVTGEYTTFFGSKANALMAMNATMTRVNGICEIDCGLHMNLIANDTVLIYTNAATDPYSDASTGAGGAWNQELQTNLTNVIGNAGYDIGHLFGATGGGGNAGCIGCVCVNPTGPNSLKKGSGFTSPADGIPQGDNFDVDYVVHEMGHQFGANHTFTFSNEGTGAQMEPGSGSTIMGYAGITGSTDVQPHSDAYFHAISIEQITNYIKSTSCQTTTVTGNAIPTADAGPDYTIPIGTPFALTGVGTDANDAGLTYCWEQMNSGTSSTTFPSVTATTGPAFRSFTPGSSPVHYFPRLSTIQAGATSWTWEAVPNVARTMNFRFTVRDNHAGGPANNSDDMVVTTTTSSGPFTVTAPNTAVTWNSGAIQAVTWNVANTTTAPVSCANVKISLSTDGGNTFPTVLVASTPNDGSENITVPNIPTTAARIKVEAVGNIFFDMSNVNFTIQIASPVLTTITTSALATNAFCKGAAVSISYINDGPANPGNYYKAQLSNAAGSFASPVNLDSVASINAVTINTTIPAGTPTGSAYRIRVVSTNPVVTGSTNGSDISISGIPAAAATISGSTSVCKGQSGVVYSVPAIANATGYTWTLPTGGSITAGTNTNSITVSYSTTASSGNVSVFGFNSGCSGTPSSLGITLISPILTSPVQVFASSSGITIHDAAAATPYPSTIAVSGLTGLIQDVNVTLNGVSHTWPDDIDILLESPTGQRVTLMSDCGAGTDLVGTVLTLNDSAAANLPDATAISAGSYKPTNYGSPDTYPSPGPGSFVAPVGASSTALSTLNGFTPNGTWKLYVVDGFAQDSGSIASWSLSIIVPVDTPVVSGTSSVCSGTNGIAYSIPAVTNATGYTWSLPSGASIASGANTNSISVNYSGGAVSGNIAVTPFNGCGNGITSKNFAVTVNNCGCANPPTANAGIPQTVCSGGSVILAGTIGGGATSSTWSAPGGTFSNANSVTSNYTPAISSGTVTLTLTTNDPDGAGACVSATSTVLITVHTAASANAGVAQTVCAGSSVTLAGSTGGSATSSTWSAPGGTFSNANSLTSNYTPGISSGTVTLTLTTNDPDGTGPCGAASSTVQITVHAAATANAGVAQTVCAGSSVTLAGSTGGSATSSTWSAPNGTFSNANSLTSNYTPGISSGTVTLTLTTNDPDGTGPCTAASSTVQITVHAAATASAGIDQTVCAGNSVTLAGSTGGSATSSTWSAPGGTFSNANSPTSNYTPGISSGTVTLILTTNDPDGTGPCAAASSTVQITVHTAASANAGPAQTVCAGSSVTLAGSTGGSATSSTWSAPSGTFSNANSLSSNYTPGISSGTVTLTLTTNDPDDSGPCTAAVSTVDILVTASVTAGVNITAVPSGAICPGTNVTFTATPVNGGTTPVYQWKKNGADVGTGSVTYLDNTLANGDQIACVLTSNAACVSGNPDTSNTITMSVDSCSSTFTLNLRVFFEGLYNAGGSLTPAIDPSGSPGLCDTIVVEMHADSPPFELVESVQGIIATNGYGNFIFQSLTLGDSYYIVVKHRNSLETWSKNPLLLDSHNVSFDFTSP